jgi:diguanylate cyclase (GGDEF)-like protein
MPNTDPQNAVALAERLRVALATLPMALAHGASLTVTASFGVATLQPEDTLDSLLARADTGLYQSKHAGRNRISCADLPSTV